MCSLIFLKHATFTFKPHLVPRWHHLCFTYDHPKNLISTFLDGELNNVQDFVLKSPVYGNWARLGQNFEPRNSFSGDLTQVGSGWDTLTYKTVVTQSSPSAPHTLMETNNALKYSIGVFSHGFTNFKRVI